jgi:hypothetical protein
MNERIKELAEEADNFCRNNIPNWTIDNYNKKYAELIITECANIVENQGRYLRYDVMSTKLKEHFGIKK